MQEKYNNYFMSFRELDEEMKKEEILKNMRELLSLLYSTNNKLLEENNMLPVLRNSGNDDEYYDLLFTYIISLKDENAKLIEYLLSITN